jgi:hypothetical protein
MITNNVPIPNAKSLLILFDYKWWIKNEEEIKNWCENTLSSFEQTGMVLRFANEKEKMLFLLRWS